MLNDFVYVGIDQTGKEGRGVIAAADRRDALARLKERGLTIIDLTEKAGGEKTFAGRRRVNHQDTYYMARELSTLLRSGMQIDKAVDILIQSADKEEMKEILSFILTNIRAGKSVTAAFQETGRFSQFLVNMIHNNEEIGRLPDAFESIAKYLRFQIQFRGEIRDAMVYPAFLIVASIMTFFVIFQFIVPRFLGIFGASADNLPAAAKLLFALSKWLSVQNVLIVASIFSVLYILSRVYPAKVRFSVLQDRLIRLPLARTLILNLELSRFSYSMHAMLEAGVEFIKALRLSTGLIRNGSLRESLEMVAVQIREGRKIADAFSHVSFLPPMIPNMIRVGEESGSLKEIFFEIYQIFDERFKTSVKRALTLLEPAIIIIMGFLVGFIVLTLIQTVMSVGSLKL
ncbi:MAG TPA: type II secretion system F family protein [Syntrophales bacterium]|nr:type II secretion system F family protein [Syntrophales bacterium]